MPLPLTVSCFSKIQIGFTFLVPAHPGSPGKRAVKRVCVCVHLSHSAVERQVFHAGDVLARDDTGLPVVHATHVCQLQRAQSVDR